MATKPADGGRERFEAWVSAPPAERSVERYGDESSTWPGQYREFMVELAWQAWCEALKGGQP